MDCFALLGMPRRPWLDAAHLKQRFLSRSAELHPDRFHQAPEGERADAGRRFAELNRAHDILTAPRDRLRHLIELERGGPLPDIQQTPPDLMDMFFECGALCREVDGFLARRDTESSPLLKAQLFREGLGHSDKIQTLSNRIAGMAGTVEQQVMDLDARWDTDRTGTLAELEALYRRTSYLERWRAQLQSRFVGLAV